LRTIQIGWSSIQILENKFQRIFLLKKNQKWPRVRMTVFEDADHAQNLIPRISITGILVLINNTPLRWISKRQKTLGTSTYGSKLVASRIDTEVIVEVRYMLWSL
jgi:hypothetical protein